MFLSMAICHEHYFSREDHYPVGLIHQVYKIHNIFHMTHNLFIYKRLEKGFSISSHQEHFKK